VLKEVSMTAEGNESKLSRNPDMIPTKELLKQKRKADYEKAKLARRQAKLVEKKNIIEQKARQRAQKDSILWQTLKKASEVETSDANETIQENFAE